MDKPIPQYLEVYSANGLLEAETMKLFLQAQGVDARVSQESAGVTFGLTVGPLGEAKVLVPESQFDMAKKIIAEMEHGDFISDENDTQEES